MKHYLILSVFLIFGIITSAQTKKEKQVADAVESLRKAMIDGNKTALEEIVSDKLSYGHSGGHIDDKKEFVDKLTTGKSDFVTMELKDQTITVNGKTAIVRHMLSATTNDNNKPGEVHLLVLLIWQKQGGHWKLWARQAVKPS